MKSMKRILCGLALVAMCGCSSTNMTRLVGQLKNDPSSFLIRQSGWGNNLTIARTNPGTNTLPHSISPDGVMSIAPK